MSKTSDRKRKVQTENGEYGKFARPVRNSRLPPVNTASTKPPNQPITTSGVKVPGRPAPARPPMPGPLSMMPSRNWNGDPFNRPKIQEDETKNPVNRRLGNSATPKWNNTPVSTTSKPTKQPAKTLDAKVDGRPAPGNLAARSPMPRPSPTRPKWEVNGLSSAKTKIHEDKTENHLVNERQSMYATPVQNGRLAPINTSAKPPNPLTKTLDVKVDGRPAPGNLAARPPTPRPSPTRPKWEVNGLSSAKTKIHEDKTENHLKNIEPATVITQSNPSAADEDKSETRLNNGEDVNKCTVGNCAVEAAIRDSITDAVLDCLGAPSFTKRLTKHVMTGIDNGIKRMASQVLFGTPDYLESLSDVPMPVLSKGVATILGCAMTEIRKEVQKTFQDMSHGLEAALSETCHTVPEIVDSIFEPMHDCLVSMVDNVPQSTKKGSKIFVTFASEVFDGAFENMLDRSCLIANQSSQVHELSVEACASDGSGEQLHADLFQKIMKEGRIDSPLSSTENASVEKQVSGDAFQMHSSDKSFSRRETPDRSNLDESLTTVKSNSEVSRSPEFMKTAVREHLKCIPSFEGEAEEGHVAESVPVEFRQNLQSSTLKRSKRSFPSVSRDLRSGDQTWTSDVAGELLQTEPFSEDSFGSLLICMENDVRISSVEKQEVKNPRLSKSKKSVELCSNGLDQDQSSGHQIKSRDEAEAASGTMRHLQDTLISGLKSLDANLCPVPELMKSAETETSEWNLSVDGEAEGGHVAELVPEEFRESSPSSILKKSRRSQSKTHRSKSKKSVELCSNGLDQDQSSGHQIKSRDEAEAASGSMRHLQDTSEWNLSVDGEAEEGHVAESVPEEFQQNLQSSTLKRSKRSFPSVSLDLRSGDQTWTSDVAGELLQTEPFSEDSFGSPLICVENAERISSVEKQEVKNLRLSKSRKSVELCSNGLDQSQSSGHQMMSHLNTDKPSDFYMDSLSDGLAEDVSKSTVKPPPMPVITQRLHHLLPRSQIPVSKSGSAVRNRRRVKGSSLPDVHVRSQSGSRMKSFP